jgi:hypothetical protein
VGGVVGVSLATNGVVEHIIARIINIANNFFIVLPPYLIYLFGPVDP